MVGIDLRSISYNKNGLISSDRNYCQRLENIRQLERAFNEVKASYAEEYDETLTNVIGQIKNKMKRNPKMKEGR
jgi:hypothetical protein